MACQGSGKISLLSSDEIKSKANTGYKGSGMSLDTIENDWTLEQLSRRASVTRKEVNKYKKSLELSNEQLQRSKTRASASQARNDIIRYTKSLNQERVDSIQATRAVNIKKGL